MSDIGLNKGVIGIILVFFLCIASGCNVAADFNLIGSELPDEVKAGVYGDANRDGVINEKDIEYVMGVISGTNSVTRFSDANMDGIVDEKDVDVIRKIINGEATELHVVDSTDRTVKVKLPVNTIIALSTASPAGMLRVLGESDKIIGINGMITGDHFYPELQDRPAVGWPGPDYEAIVKLNPDLIIASANPAYVERLRTS